MIWKSCSRIGSAPPTSIAVTMPLPIANALCIPIIVQSFAPGLKRLIGPIKPEGEREQPDGEADAKVRRESAGCGGAPAA